LTASANITDNITGVITLTTVQPVVKKNIKVNRSTGLFDVTIKVTNLSPYPVDGFRLHVDFSAYQAAHPSLRLQNASSPSKSRDVYLDYRPTVAVNGSVNLVLSFYTKNRKFPKRFRPICIAEGLRSAASPAVLLGRPNHTTRSTSSASATPLIALTVPPAVPEPPRLTVMPDRRVELEFPATPGRWYRVSYTSDMIHWIDCPTPEQATGSRLFWTDSGPPCTVTHPAGEPTRFYRAREVTAP
jgi:hypothetical protein